jgi:hypothetical protein
MNFEEANRLFWYEEDTGNLFWKKKGSGKRNHLKAGSYSWRARVVVVSYKKYPVSKIVWLLATGDWPENSLDHIDRNPDNNKISNLRPATFQQNMANRVFRRAVSGYIGVCWREKRGKFSATHYAAGQCKHLGYYATAEEAALVRDEAAKMAHGSFAILNFPSGKNRSLV